jgi:hypothetical protein
MPAVALLIARTSRTGFSRDDLLHQCLSAESRAQTHGSPTAPCLSQIADELIALTKVHRLLLMHPLEICRYGIEPI